MEEDIKKIARHYGLEKQLPVLQEECAELIQAASKLIRNMQNDTDPKETDALIIRITEEIADVEVTVAETEMLLGIRIEDVDALKRYKVRRQLGRISKEGELRE